jgi:hypothetical protein
MVCLHYKFVDIQASSNLFKQLLFVMNNKHAPNITLVALQDIYDCIVDHTDEHYFPRMYRNL